MSKEYQRRKNNKYQLPTEVYHMTLWMIRDYYRMTERLDEILVESPSPPDGMPTGHNSQGEVISKVEKREELKKKTLAIEEALKTIPSEYAKGVWNNIQFRTAYPSDANRNTYGRWKAKFVYNVALNMKFISKD